MELDIYDVQGLFPKADYLRGMQYYHQNRVKALRWDKQQVSCYVQGAELYQVSFRALYLDSVLSDGDGILVTRDREFRAMIRNFKSVAEGDYKIPEAVEPILRPYQKVGFQWLKTLESCGFGGILADEMGLGKTLQVIAYLASLDRQAVGCPSLVVCPTSLILNWGEELKKFAPKLSCALIYGTASERKQQRRDATDSDVWVTSYELLRQDARDYGQLRFYCCAGRGSAHQESVHAGFQSGEAHRLPPALCPHGNPHRKPAQRAVEPV